MSESNHWTHCERLGGGYMLCSRRVLVLVSNRTQPLWRRLLNRFLRFPGPRTDDPLSSHRRSSAADNVREVILSDRLSGQRAGNSSSD